MRAVEASGILNAMEIDESPLRKLISDYMERRNAMAYRYAHGHVTQLDFVRACNFYAGKFDELFPNVSHVDYGAVIAATKLYETESIWEALAELLNLAFERKR